MSGPVFFIFSFFVFAVLMVCLIVCVKGRLAVYLTAVGATLSAWSVGVFLDANIDFDPAGFLAFRMLLPILAMGICILRAVMKDNAD